MIIIVFVKSAIDTETFDVAAGFKPSKWSLYGNLFWHYFSWVYSIQSIIIYKANQVNIQFAMKKVSYPR